MTPKTLRVRARGDALVQDHERLERGTNAFLGREFREHPEQPGQMAFVPTDKVVEVPYRAEYVLALRNGELDAADRATADAAGVKLSAEHDDLPPPRSFDISSTDFAVDTEKGDR